MAYASWQQITLQQKLNPADTSLLADVDVWITAGRFYFVNDQQEEWIDFTWVSASGSNFSYTWLTRGLSQTADPATAWTGKTWIAWSGWTLVAMHDQLADKQKDNTFEWNNTYEWVETFEEAIITEKWVASTVYADTTARDAALWWDWVATKAYTGILAWSVYYNYNTATAQWESIDTWTVTPDASETVAGKVEIPTQTQSDDWDDTWDTWAFVATTPQRVGRSIQKQAYTYDEDTWVANAYVVTLSPTPSAYVEWMKISVKIGSWNTSTWASTINVNSLWAKIIQDKDGDAIIAGQITAWETYDMVYDWIQFRLTTVSKASDDEVFIWTNDTKFVTAKQVNYTPISWTENTIAFANTERNSLDTSYVKVKEIEVNKTWVYSTTMDLKWEWWTPSWNWRIYINGVAVWTEHNISSTSYNTFTDSSISVTKWDLVQVYIKNVSWRAYVRNFQIKCNIDYWITTVNID
jgi:hypothetical protein